MRPTHRTSSVMLILGILLVINSGCGKKHLHVSTMSGAPGEGELAMGLDDSGNIGDQSGLGTGSGLDESGLGNQEPEPETAASSTDDLEPLDFSHDVTPPSQALDSPTDGDLSAGLDGGTDSTEAPGQEIQTQSPSMDDRTNDSNLRAPESDSLPPIVAFNNPDGSDIPVEQIPGNFAVAKAEPSDAFREQLNKMKEEEAATLAAGLNDVFFEFDSWTLTTEGRQALDQGAEWLHGKASAKLLIEGYCDARGTQAYNLVLGKKRAGAIRDYLVELGIIPERLAIISYGQEKQFCSDPTEVCYQLNRRGHLLVQNQ